VLNSHWRAEKQKLLYG